MPSTQPGMERLFVEMPEELKRGLEALALRHRQQHHRELGNVAALVRAAVDQLLRDQLPDYVSPYQDPPMPRQE